MREIIFRGKRKDNGEWVEGYYARKGVDKDTFKHFICVMTFNVNGNTYSSMFYLTDIEVIPETVGQYTGLTDKNGTKIFEGDIVKTKYGILCEVCWFSSPCSQCWDLIPIEDKHKATDEYDLWIPKNLEVIGNIHDNPKRLQN